MARYGNPAYGPTNPYVTDIGGNIAKLLLARKSPKTLEEEQAKADLQGAQMQNYGAEAAKHQAEAAQIDATNKARDPSAFAGQEAAVTGRSLGDILLATQQIDGRPEQGPFEQPMTPEDLGGIRGDMRSFSMLRALGGNQKADDYAKSQALNVGDMMMRGGADPSAVARRQAALEGKGTTRLVGGELYDEAGLPSQDVNVTPVGKAHIKQMERAPAVGLVPSYTGVDENGNPTFTFQPKTAGSTVVKPGSGEFTDEMGRLMGAFAERGVSLPAGFRSKSQQVQMLKGLLDRNPGKAPEEIADLVRTGQIDLGAVKKETQTAAAQAGRVSIAGNELQEFIPLVREASAKVPRGNFVPLNRLMQMADTSISDPSLKALKVRINAALNAYDQLAARGGTDMNKRQEVRDLLMSADGPQALEAALSSFEVEAAAAKRAADKATHVQPSQKTPAQSLGLTPHQINSDAEYNALPSGTEFLAPDGSHRKKP